MRCCGVDFEMVELDFFEWEIGNSKMLAEARLIRSRVIFCFGFYPRLRSAALVAINMLARGLGAEWKIMDI